MWVNTEVFCHFYVSRTTPLQFTCIYRPFLAFCARKRVYSCGYYKFSSDAKRVFYAFKSLYLLVTSSPLRTQIRPFAYAKSM